MSNRATLFFTLVVKLHCEDQAYLMHEIRSLFQLQGSCIDETFHALNDNFIVSKYVMLQTHSLLYFQRRKSLSQLPWPHGFHMMNDEMLEPKSQGALGCRFETNFAIAGPIS